MKGWRPEGWKNPHQGLPTDEIFEAGADAIFANIYDKGQFGHCVASYFTLADHGSRIYTIQVKTRSQFKDPQRINVGDDGILVFIPFRY